MAAVVRAWWSAAIPEGPTQLNAKSRPIKLPQCVLAPKLDVEVGVGAVLGAVDPASVSPVARAPPCGILAEGAAAGAGADIFG